MYLFRKTFFDLSRQWRYLQLEKSSGIEIEMRIHERLAIDLLEGIAKRTPFPDLIGLTKFSSFQMKKCIQKKDTNSFCVPEMTTTTKLQQEP